MQPYRWGNGDFRITLTQLELSEIEKLEKVTTYRGKLKAQLHDDPLKGKILALTYRPIDEEPPIDTRQMVKNFDTQEIPVYINRRTARIIRAHGFAAGAIMQWKVEIKLAA